MARTDFDGGRLLELARRQHASVEVALFWDRAASLALIVVWNWNSGTCLQLNADATEAKYAFAHPYAYAAAQGVSEQDLLRAA